MSFLIIIPAFNESEILERTVETALLCDDADILIVDDGSTDGTTLRACEMAAQNQRVDSISLPVNCGIGSAMQSGFLYAARYGYQAAAQFDGDGQHSVESLLQLRQKARDENLDLCIGSRFLDLSSENFQSTPLRRFGILFLAKLISLLVGSRVTDPTSGLRVYGRRAIELFAQCYPDDYPEPEALLLASRKGFRIAEAPAVMFERQTGSSSIRYLKTAYYMIKVTTAILIERMRGDKL